MLDEASSSFSRGELGKTIEQARAALALEPRNGAGLQLLAMAYAEQGDAERALGVAMRAVNLQPKSAASNYVAAFVESRLGKFREALTHIDRVLEAVPGHDAAWALKLDVLSHAEGVDAAIDAANRAVTEHPQNGDTALMRGLLLRRAGRLPEALEAFAAAAAFPATRHRALVATSVAYTETGKADDAAQSAADAVALNPNSAEAWYTHSRVKKFAAGDPDIAEMERLLSQKTELVSECVMLEFALGKAYLDAGDARRAFEHFDAGNRCKRRALSYDPDEAERRMRAIPAVFSAEFFARFAGSGEPSDVPVFVVGMVRSGTTLVEQILASHPAVAATGESTMFTDAAAEAGATGAPVFAEFARGAGCGDFAEIGRRYLERARASSPDAARVVNKTTTNFLHAGLIRLSLPGAKIIHCRRDPLDTCYSAYTKLFEGTFEYTYDQAELGRYYRAYAQLCEYWKSALPAETFLEVVYEVLVADFERQARRIIEFCGLPWDDRCLRFHETERPIYTASQLQVRRPLTSDSVGSARRFAEFLGPLIGEL